MNFQKLKEQQSGLIFFYKVQDAEKLLKQWNVKIV
jgi:hypothetical protein